jgi:hypothetical protein
MIPRYLPTLIMAESVAAGIMYLTHGDVRRGIYWLAAAVLNAAVTF